MRPSPFAFLPSSLMFVAILLLCIWLFAVIVNSEEREEGTAIAGRHGQTEMMMPTPTENGESDGNTKIKPKKVKKKVVRRKVTTVTRRRRKLLNTADEDDEGRNNDGGAGLDDTSQIESALERALLSSSARKVADPLPPPLTLAQTKSGKSTNQKAPVTITSADRVQTVLEWDEQRAPTICGDHKWHFFDGFCYKLITSIGNDGNGDKQLLPAGGGTWTEALEACKKQRASLASIHSEQENEFVASLSAQIDGNSDNFCNGFWIGMTRKRTDPARDIYTCKWADGTPPTFGNVPDHNHMPPWRGGQPDNGGGREECVQMYPRLGCNSQFYGEWNDFPCDDKLAGAVCKKRMPIRRL